MMSKGNADSGGVGSSKTRITASRAISLEYSEKRKIASSPHLWTERKSTIGFVEGSTVYEVHDD